MHIKAQDMRSCNMSNFFDKLTYNQRSKTNDQMYVYYQNLGDPNHD